MPFDEFLQGFSESKLCLIIRDSPEFRLACEQLEMAGWQISSLVAGSYKHIFDYAMDKWDEFASIRKSSYGPNWITASYVTKECEGIEPSDLDPGRKSKVEDELSSLLVG